MKSRRTPPTVVTLHAAVRVRDLTGGEHQELTLVSPREADVSAGRISVLAPLGTALKRLLIGSVADRLLRAAECERARGSVFSRRGGRSCRARPSRQSCIAGSVRSAVVHVCCFAAPLLKVPVPVPPPYGHVVAPPGQNLM